MNKQLSNHNHAQKVAENFELDARVQPPPIVFNIPCFDIDLPPIESVPIFHGNITDVNDTK